jgi:putative ABC transport system substrate-binding protein
MPINRFRRRDFVILLGGLTAWRTAARAQPRTPPRIGFLSGQSAVTFAPLTAAFLKGLKDTGFVEGRNVAIEYRWAEGKFEQLPAMAADLVGRQVDVIVATGGEPSIFAARAATMQIPIVFTAGADPVRQGLVNSINRPAGNLTGMYFLASAVETKRLGILRELVPSASTIAVLWNPNGPGGTAQLNDIQEAARLVGQPIMVLNASSEPDIDASFSTIALQRIGALLITADPFFSNRLAYVQNLTERHAIPAIYALREFAMAGGLASYGASLSSAFHQVGIYAGKILTGEKAGDLPIMQPTKFELVINLRTAKALGLAVPNTLLALADETIE